jgi:hypothetical protein
MKIGGIDPTTLSNIEILVLPRGNDQIVFKATGLSSYDEFDALCPEPKAPGVHKPNGDFVPNPEDPSYRDMVNTWSRKRMAYMAIKSLEPSSIEWDTVKIDNPSTWLKWQDDLKSAGFTQVECNRIMGLVLDANCLNEDRLEKAREVFLLGQGVEQGTSSGPNTEPKSTPSGEPAKG